MNVKLIVIAQNVKSLRYLFPSTLIYSCCAQFGSMITIAFQAFNLPTAPLCIFHIFFNLSFLLIYFRHYCINPDRISTTTIKNERTVKNPLGKFIPTNVTSEQYFQALQHQWN
uniref:Uncharacterized protein n=1 Tax=Panagrolaimus davidi TaxID=227884 RepID=A0A914QUG2_9BILA